MCHLDLKLNIITVSICRSPIGMLKYNPYANMGRQNSRVNVIIQYVAIIN